METLGLYLGIIASIIAIGGVLWGVEKKWHPARRFWDWLYSHTTAYRVQQLEKQVAGVTNLWVLERESKEAQIKALEESQARYAKVIADKAQETEAAQAQSLQTQMESYRKELVQADAAMQWVRKELFRLHQSSEHPNELTTTEGGARRAAASGGHTASDLALPRAR